MAVHVQTPAEALADALHGLDARIHAPLDEVPSLRVQWAESLIERLRARGYDVLPAQSTSEQPTFF